LPRVLFAVLALALGACGSAWAQGQAAGPNQQAFMTGVRAIDAGDFATAIRVLRALADTTGAPRVRLELARALYLDKQYLRAREAFLKVYRQPNLPYRVRRTINVFLADIDQRAGYFEPSVGLEVNSNPAQIASSGTYQILGIPLQFERRTSARAVGLSLGGAGAAPLGGAGWSLVGSANGAAYTSRGASFVQAMAEVRAPTDRGLGWDGLGASVYKLDLNDRVATLFVEKTRRFPLSNDRQLTLHGSVSRIDVSPDRAFDGFGVEGDVSYGFDLNRNTALNLALGGSYATAEDRVDRRLSGVGTVDLIRALPKLNKTVILSATEAVTRFGDVDPLFGARRRDLQSTLQLKVLNGTPIHGLFPGVSFTYDRRDSTIPFFAYARRLVAIELRRRF
jgi:hypothetical protein